MSVWVAPGALLPCSWTWQWVPVGAFARAGDGRGGGDGRSEGGGVVVDRRERDRLREKSKRMCRWRKMRTTVGGRRSVGGGRWSDPGRRGGEERKKEEESRATVTYLYLFATRCLLCERVVIVELVRSIVAIVVQLQPGHLRRFTWAARSAW